MTPNRDGSQRDAGPGLKLVLENWALRFLLIGLISLVFFSLGIGKWLATNLTTNSATQDDINHFFGEIGFAFTIAAFLILTTERNAKRELHSQFSQCMDLIRAEFRQSLQRFSSVESISSFLYRVHSGVNNKEIQALADDIFNEYTTELFIVEGDGFAIADRNWAMEANKKFYAMLLSARLKMIPFDLKLLRADA